MHERAQRATAQLLFVLCCAFPTLITVSIIAVQCMPWYHQAAVQDFESELSLRTGTLVSIDAMHRRSPTALRFDGVQLSDPESGREIVKVVGVDWRRTDEETALVLHQPEFRASELGAAWRLFHDRFLRQPDQTDRPFRFAANDLTVHSRAQSMTLRDVDASIESDDRGVAAYFQAVLAASDDVSPVLVSVTRDRVRRDSGRVTPTTTWTLTTGSTPLPCSALADFFPKYLGRLGPEATFTGTMRFAVNDEGWTLDLGGCRFDQVALDWLFQDQSFRLSGTASIDLQQGLIEPGQRLQWLGTLRARDGVIGQRLLQAMKQHWGVAIAEFDGPQPVPFDQLAMRFDLSDTRMTLSGVCDGEPGYGDLPPGILICHRDYAVAACQPVEMPALQLASLMSSDSAVAVGVTSRNQSLLRWLVPPRTNLRVPPHTTPKIRTATRLHGDDPLVQPR